MLSERPRSDPARLARPLRSRARGSALRALSDSRGSLSALARRALFAVSCSALAALALDAATTYAALTTPGQPFAEQTEATARLIAALGLGAGLAVTFAARAATFAAVLIAARRYPKLAWPLFAVAALGAGVTAAIGLANLAVLTR